MLWQILAKFGIPVLPFDVIMKMYTEIDERRKSKGNISINLRSASRCGVDE
jgi:hypothetical protein